MKKSCGNEVKESIKWVILCDGRIPGREEVTEQALKIRKEERWWYSGMGTEWNTETEQSSYRVTKPRVIYIVYSLGLLVNVCHIYT